MSRQGSQQSQGSLVVPPAAYPPVGQQHQDAAGAYLAREKAIFGRTESPSEEVLRASITNSDRAKAMEEYLIQLNVMGVGQYYEMAEGTYLVKPKLGSPTLDRAFNEYGYKEQIAKKIAQAHLSVIERDAVTTEMQAGRIDQAVEDVQLIAEVREKYLERYPEEVLGESLTDIQRRTLTQLLKEKRIKDTAQRAKDKALVDQVGEIYRQNYPGETLNAASLTDEQREKLTQLLADKLFVEHFPILKRLLDSPNTEAVANKGLTEVAKSYPQEMVGRAQHYYPELEVDSPATSRAILESKLGHWMADNISIALLYVQNILEANPQLIDNLKQRYDFESAETEESDTGNKEQSFYAKLTATLMLGLSDLMLATFPKDNPLISHGGPLYPYFAFLLTKLTNTGLAELKLPESYQLRPFGVLEYMVYLLENLNTPAKWAHPEDADNVNKFKKKLSLYDTSMVSAEFIVERFQEHSDNAVRFNNYLNVFSRLFKEDEYSNFIDHLVNRPSDEDPEFDVVEFFKHVSRGLDGTAQPGYVKLTAALFFSYGAIPKVQREILVLVPKTQRLAVSEAIVVGSASLPADYPNLQAMNVAMIKFAMQAYLEGKSVYEEGEGSGLKEFNSLKPVQQAERNITAAYEILALIDQLEIYNKSNASPLDKKAVYEAVMSLVLYLRAEAEIRGQRPAQLYKQSSQFAQLLNYDIPGIPKSVIPAKVEAFLDTKIDLAAYREIKRQYEAENTWRKRFSKKLNNWAAQNPNTFFAVTLGISLMVAGVLTLSLVYFAPAIIALIPFMGGLAPSAFVLPGVGALIGGALLSVLATAINSIYYSANAKIKNIPVIELSEISAGQAHASRLTEVTPARVAEEQQRAHHGFSLTPPNTTVAGDAHHGVGVKVGVSLQQPGGSTGAAGGDPIPSKPVEEVSSRGPGR